MRRLTRGHPGGRVAVSPHCGSSHRCYGCRCFQVVGMCGSVCPRGSRSGSCVNLEPRGEQKPRLYNWWNELDLSAVFCSPTLIQGGAERRRGSRSHSCVCLCLDQHTILGGGLEVAQNDALHLPGGADAQAVPPSELFVCGVVLPVADGVAAEDPVYEIWIWGLKREVVTLLRGAGLNLP